MQLFIFSQLHMGGDTLFVQICQNAPHPRMRDAGLCTAKSRRVKQCFIRRLAYGIQARITRLSALSH